jgi:hypothetical protein
MRNLVRSAGFGVLSTGFSPTGVDIPHRGQAHRRSEIGTILPLAPLSPVSRGKIEETDSGKTDYRHRSRTGCGAGEVDGFWLDLLAYSDSARWGWQERLGRYIWGDRASWLSWYHH